MLRKSGGTQRIKEYAASLGQSVDAVKIHASKSRIFQEYLGMGKAEPRQGVVETIIQAKKQGLKLGFVTTTSKENVFSLLSALAPDIDKANFDLITDASMVKRSKPAKDAYILALQELNEKAENCVAIEDNLGGQMAARSAGISCVAFRRENTTDHDVSLADLWIDQLSFDVLKKFI